MKLAFIPDGGGGPERVNTVICVTPALLADSAAFSAFVADQLREALQKDMGSVLVKVIAAA